MDIKRETYLNNLISKMNNGLIKIITGLRRCGKSYLLFNQFYNYLINFGVKKDHIITFAFDTDDDLDKLDDYYNELPTKKYDRSSRIYLINSKKFRAYIKEKIKDEGKYYIIKWIFKKFKFRCLRNWE